MSNENKRGNILLLDPDKVVLNEEKNGRVDPHDDDAINELVQSFKEFGQLQPVVGRKTSDKGIEIILGFRRTQAMRKLNEELLQHGDEPMLLKVSMSVMNDMQAFKANIVENRQRKQTTALDDAHNQNVLRIKHNMNNNEIGAFYQMNPSRVSQLSKLMTLNEDIKRMVHNRELTIGNAFDLAGLSEEDQLEIVKEDKQRQIDVEDQASHEITVPSEIHKDNVARVDDEEEVKPKKKAGRPNGKGKGIKEAAAKKKGKGTKAVSKVSDDEIKTSRMAEMLQECIENTESDAVGDICAFFLGYCKGEIGSSDMQKTLEEWCEKNTNQLQEA